MVLVMNCSIVVSAIEIINAGHRGNATANLLSRIEADVLNEKPSLVIMMAGTNDMLNSAKLTPFQQYSNRLESLIQQIIKTNAKMILMTIPPFYEKYLLKRHDAGKYKPYTPLSRVVEANKIIKSLGEKYLIPIVDVYTIFSENGGVTEEESSLLRNVANAGTADGVHPTSKGYTLMALAIAKTIRQFKLPTTKIVCFGDSITYGTGVIRGIDDYPTQLYKLLSKK